MTQTALANDITRPEYDLQPHLVGFPAHVACTRDRVLALMVGRLLKQGSYGSYGSYGVGAELKKCAYRVDSKACAVGVLLSDDEASKLQADNLVVSNARPLLPIHLRLHLRTLAIAQDFHDADAVDDSSILATCLRIARLR